MDKGEKINAVIVLVAIIAFILFGIYGCETNYNLPDEQVQQTDTEVRDTFNFIDVGVTHIRSEYRERNVMHSCCAYNWNCAHPDTLAAIQPFYAVSNVSEYIWEVISPRVQDSVDLVLTAVNDGNGNFTQGNCDTIRDYTGHYTDVCDLVLPNSYDCP